jgi:hypothetical protein
VNDNNVYSKILMKRWSYYLVTRSRIEYKMGGHSSDPCVLTTLDPLCVQYYANRNFL